MEPSVSSRFHKREEDQIGSFATETRSLRSNLVSGTNIRFAKVSRHRKMRVPHSGERRIAEEKSFNRAGFVAWFWNRFTSSNPGLDENNSVIRSPSFTATANCCRIDDEQDFRTGFLFLCSRS